MALLRRGRLGEVDYMARDYLAFVTHTPIDKIEVHVISVEVPPLGDVVSGAQRIVRERIAAAAASAKAQEDAAEYAKELIAAKVPFATSRTFLACHFSESASLFRLPSVARFKNRTGYGRRRRPAGVAPRRIDRRDPCE